VVVNPALPVRNIAELVAPAGTPREPVQRYADAMANGSAGAAID